MMLLRVNCNHEALQMAWNVGDETRSGQRVGVSRFLDVYLAVDQAIAGRAGAQVVLLLRAVPKSAGAKLQRKLQWTKTFGHGRRHAVSTD